MRVVARLIMLLTMFVVYGALADCFRGDIAFFTRMLIVLPLTFVSVFFHELGHAVAVLLVGGRVKRFVAYPMALSFRPRQLRWRLRERGSEIGGYVAYEIDRIHSRHRHLVVAAAGPLASLLLALVCGGAASAIQPIHPNRLVETGATEALLTALALLSGGAGIANLVPFTGSDGKHILDRLFPKKPYRP